MKKYLLALVVLMVPLLLAHPAHAVDSIGTIDVPPGVDKYQAASGADIGIIFFISNLIKIFSVIAGVWVVFNIILASYIYIVGSGEAGNHEKVRNQITNSVIGLLLIVMSYTIGGLIGFLFFGDAAFILNPTLPTP